MQKITPYFFIGLLALPKKRVRKKAKNQRWSPLRKSKIKP
jgi:hypothetical protein